MSYVVIAKWTAKTGCEDELRAVLEEMTGPSAAEAGCTSYEVLQCVGDARTFVLLEVYVDEDAYRAHGASPHFQEIAVARGFPLLEGRERLFCEPLRTSTSR